MFSACFWLYVRFLKYVTLIDSIEALFQIKEGALFPIFGYVRFKLSEFARATLISKLALNRTVLTLSTCL